MCLVNWVCVVDIVVGVIVLVFMSCLYVFDYEIFVCEFVEVGFIEFMVFFVCMYLGVEIFFFMMGCVGFGEVGG